MTAEIWCVNSFRTSAACSQRSTDIIAQEIVEDLQAALAQFVEIASDLKK